MNRRLVGQLFRYGVVGIGVNVAGYLLYLFITYLGVAPMLAMSVLYVVGAVGGFWGNKTLTFSHDGNSMRAAVRYVIAHFAGYLINLGILTVMTHELGYSHQVAQAVGIVVVAGFLFLASRFFVFTSFQEARSE